MIVEVHNKCDDFDSYRAARVKSLFNAETGANFDLVAELPVEDDSWKIGVIVGPSGSGKSSLGRAFWGEDAFFKADWPADKPIIDAIAPGGNFDAVTAALGTVGLGDVPAWLRPYPVLSNGERFRADLARIISEAPTHVVVDEFTSVVDRQIAKVGALAFAKSWRRTSGQALLLTPHYDVLEWLEPDWVYDTRTKHLARDRLQRPRVELEIFQTDWRYWPLFEPHHYLKAEKMPAAICYVGSVDGELVAHMGISTAYNRQTGIEARGCRLVIMPEWQGAGVGTKFLNFICELQLQGKGRMPGRRLTTIFHTSHPGLCAALRRDPKWRQISAALYGVNKRRSKATGDKAAKNHAKTLAGTGFLGNRPGYGGHMRAVQGFRYYGVTS